MIYSGSISLFTNILIIRCRSGASIWATSPRQVQLRRPSASLDCGLQQLLALLGRIEGSMAYTNFVLTALLVMVQTSEVKKPARLDGLDRLYFKRVWEPGAALDISDGM